MKQMKRIIQSALLLLLTLTMHAQVSVEARIDSIQMFIGEQVHLTLSATVTDGQQPVFPVYQRTQQMVPGVEVLSQNDDDTLHLDGGKVRMSRTYTLTSFDDTLYYLPPLSVTVDGKQYQSKSLALKVLGVEVDTIHPEQFYPAKDVQDNPFSWDDWSTAFWLSLVLLVVLGAVWYLYTRLRDNKPIVSHIRIIRRALPHQKAMKEIEHIQHEHLSASQDQKTYYTRLTDTLRTYLEERFGFSAMEMTSDEIIERLQQEEDQTKIDELRQLFHTADLVKFAKHAALINENDRNLATAIAFIDETKKEDMPTEQRIQPTLTDSERRSQRQRLTVIIIMGVLIVAALSLVAYIGWRLYLLLA